MSTQAVHIQHEDLEVIDTEPEVDVHDGRPVRPEYRLRGEMLMLQWALEDAS